VHEEADTPPPRRISAVIRREAWLVVVVFWLAICVSLAITGLQTPKYRASMSLVVGQAGGDFAPEIGDQALTQTMTTLLRSEIVASAAIQKLKLDTTPEKFLDNLTVTVAPASSVLEVSYVGENPRQIEAALDEVGHAFTRLADEKLGVQPQTSALGGKGSRPLVFATVYNPPHADPRPISPKRGLAVVTAGALGLVLGLVLAFVRERLDDRVRSREEAEDAFGLPVIGVLPRLDRRRRPGKQRQLDEAMSLLSLNLEVSNGAARPGNGGTILVTSTQQEEGKSSVVAILAQALARGGGDVVCVEADAHPPTVANYLAVTSPSVNGKSHGTEQQSLEALLRPVPLTVNGNGNGHSDGRLRVLDGELWRTMLGQPVREERGAQVMGALRSEADHVLIDAAPLTIGDTSRLALVAGQVVIVARIGKTRRSRARTASEVMQRLGVSATGVVLTDAKPDGA
jgi:polysaccharide biosynthesis transport protein